MVSVGDRVGFHGTVRRKGFDGKIYTSHAEFGHVSKIDGKVIQVRSLGGRAFDFVGDGALTFLSEEQWVRYETLGLLM